MQEFNSLIVHSAILSKIIKNNFTNKNKENRYNNHITSHKSIKTNWKKTIKLEKTIKEKIIKNNTFKY